MWAVQFERSELTRALKRRVVPARTDRHVILSGTERDVPRCDALEGEVGVRTKCGIYRDRPAPCHEVRASWEDGVRDASCHEARVRHGLPPLMPRDWL